MELLDEELKYLGMLMYALGCLKSKKIGALVLCESFRQKLGSQFTAGGNFKG